MTATRKTTSQPNQALWAERSVLSVLSVHVPQQAAGSAPPPLPNPNNNYRSRPKHHSKLRPAAHRRYHRRTNLPSVGVATGSRHSGSPHLSSVISQERTAPANLAQFTAAHASASTRRPAPRRASASSPSWCGSSPAAAAPSGVSRCMKCRLSVTVFDRELDMVTELDREAVVFVCERAWYVKELARGESWRVSSSKHTPIDSTVLVKPHTV